MKDQSFKFVEGDYTYYFSFYKKDHLGFAKIANDGSDELGWNGYYREAPLSEAQRAFCDRLLKLKVFW